MQLQGKINITMETHRDHHKTSGIPAKQGTACGYNVQLLKQCEFNDHPTNQHQLLHTKFAAKQVWTFHVPQHQRYYSKNNGATLL